MICGSGGSKSRLAKAAGAEPAGQMRHGKVHAVVARSTFPSQNGQNTRGADHFWKLRCRKSARCCGAKHILKSKCAKHTMVGPLLEVAMSKKCTPLWREAHFEGHNGVQIFISHLASWLRTRRFSEPTFRPSGATNHWKNAVFRDFPTFSRICIFFLLTLSLLIFSLLIFLFSLPLPCSAFHLSILSEV